MDGIEWIAEMAPNDYQVALFDFDGTVSLIREGWQPIMYQYFVEVLASTPEAEDEGALWKVVQEFVDLLTGKQTIYQMMQLAEEVTKRGGEPLPPLAYKDEYHRRLWTVVEGRVAGLEDGTIDPEDMMVPGVKGMLEALQERGLSLYLASGTDEKYVLNEARALGVDGFFAGIYGAQDDYKQFSKAKVIQHLLASKEIGSRHLLGFGDGYVEIENVKHVGGTAVGVASDEKHRAGVDEWKRKRLIAAGADVIIPDFRCHHTLLQQLLEGR